MFAFSKWVKTDVLEDHTGLLKVKLIVFSNNLFACLLLGLLINRVGWLIRVKCPESGSSPEEVP